MRRDSTHNDLDEYELLLESNKFENLRNARLDCAVDKELIWFSATDSCSIGLDDSGSMIWMLNQQRACHEW